jgi:hypothetical protein
MLSMMKCALLSTILNNYGYRVAAFTREIAEYFGGHLTALMPNVAVNFSFDWWPEWNTVNGLPFERPGVGCLGNSSCFPVQSRDVLSR